ncbi:lipase 1-like [Pararge aegeria]|uniref:Lipase n=1 Tax=Pararge aegeria aegeria TaxID=348720 RepID=A0A8S4SBF1_9NEOP|nr:lipase 1-like [Pararge aegeria]XP_039749161.1 lipase 1-like [Pararge aegeria]XP_039749169.1 lipase 1-like [Pararge aegeria]CAH2261198.1 jg17206 [Pararge aegeria aegeria]
MASKANVTFNVLLLSVAIIVGNVIRLKVIPINNEVKRYLGYHEDSYLNFTEISAKYGYISEEHTVTTEDGYMLTIFRMRKRSCRQFKRPPVILMHGLLQSADVWLDAGPNAGLAYLIADECHDLWVGNQRGNYYGRRHARLDPDRDPKFWKFCVDEIGHYDIPATIDYVLKNTGEKKLNYVGFSQGAGTFLIMCSERPGYCDKANILIGLAPAARQTHTRSVPFRALTEGISKLEGVLFSTGFHELFYKGAIEQEFFSFLCKFRATSEALCNAIIAAIDAFHPGSVGNETLRVLYGHFPAGTSTHNMARYGQSMQSRKFQKFDYGKERNLEIYGAEQPASYNLTAVTVPVVVLYGRNDRLVDTRDVFWLVKRLPNVLEASEVADPLWNHLDGTYSQFNKRLIFPQLNQYLLQYSEV